MSFDFETMRADDFMRYDFPPIEQLLDPWLPKSGLAMVAGYRGSCKTWLGMGVGYAVATGGKLLGWQVPKPARVLYVDGEMNAAETAMRLRMIDKAARMDKNGKPDLLGDNFEFFHHQLFEKGIPDLADPGGLGRQMVEAASNGVSLIVLDNLSCLCRTGVENDSESWVSMQDWLISLRRKGISVLMLHHAGKPDQFGNVQQRGTSKREDVLNSSLLLNKPSNNGNFKLEFTKNRGFTRPEDMHVALSIGGGCARLVEIDRGQEALEHYNSGMTLKEVAAVMHISIGTVSKLIPDGLKRGHGGPRSGAGRPAAAGSSSDQVSPKNLLDEMEEC